LQALGLEAGIAFGGLGGVEPALIDQLVPLRAERIARLGDGLGLGVEQQHGAAGLGGDLGDAAAHRAGAHDAHGVEARRSHGGRLWCTPFATQKIAAGA